MQLEHCSIIIFKIQSSVWLVGDMSCTMEYPCQIVHLRQLYLFRFEYLKVLFFPTKDIDLVDLSCEAEHVCHIKANKYVGCYEA